MEQLFQEGEESVRDKLIHSFKDDRGAYEAFWLFRTQDHVDYFNQVMCDNKYIAKDFASKIHYITDYSNRFEDYQKVVECMDENINRSALLDIYRGPRLEEQLHGQKYYRYALFKKYVRDFRLEQIKKFSDDPRQIKRSRFFARLERDAFM